MKKENIPNALTLIRIVFIPIFIVMLIFGKSYGWHVAAAIVFAVASITDYLDGYLARKWNVVSNFGKFADPIADKLLINTIFLLLASDGTISIIIPIIMISRDTIVDAIRLVAANKQVVIAAKYLGKLKTVTQMISVIFLLLNDFPFSIIHLPVGQIMVWVACIISVVSGIDYFMDSKDMLTESM